MAVLIQYLGQYNLHNIHSRWKQCTAKECTARECTVRECICLLSPVLF